MVCSLLGWSVLVCRQPSQVASCRSHSTGIEKPSSADVCVKGSDLVAMIGWEEDRAARLVHRRLRVADWLEEWKRSSRWQEAAQAQSVKSRTRATLTLPLPRQSHCCFVGLEYLTVTRPSIS